jgi:hypothetical protein
MLSDNNVINKPFLGVIMLNVIMLSVVQQVGIRKLYNIDIPEPQ